MPRRRTSVLIAFALGSAFCLASVAQADNGAIRSSTALPQDARYEIIQSAILGLITLKVDRFTGATFGLVHYVEGDTYGWEPIDREIQANYKLLNATRANYQVFTSGLVAKSTFLTNVNTGTTWMLIKTRSGSQLWEAMH